jgi:hypothetical protein
MKLGRNFIEFINQCESAEACDCKCMECEEIWNILKNKISEKLNERDKLITQYANKLIKNHVEMENLRVELSFERARSPERRLSLTGE